MEGVMTALADKQQTRLRAIGSRGMTTDGASFARVVGIHLDCHRTLRKSFISNHGLQFSKRPFGVGGIGFALLPTRFLASLAFGSIANGCQVLQADHALRVLINDAFGDYMIGVLLQPSLSSAYHHQATGSRASAFVLKTLPQSRIMISFGNHLFARIEGTISLRGGSHGKIAYPNIHPSHTRLGLWCWVSSPFRERPADRSMSWVCHTTDEPLLFQHRSLSRQHACHSLYKAQSHALPESGYSPVVLS